MRSEFRTFDVIREIAARPERVWRVWTDPALKEDWFARGGGLPYRNWTCDPTEGGGETCSFELPGTGWIDYASHVIALQPTDRLIYSYTMTLGPRLLSVSLVTVTFEPSGTGTRLVYTEQASFLDGGDRLETRYAGTIALLDRIVRACEELRA